MRRNEAHTLETSRGRGVFEAKFCRFAYRYRYTNYHADSTRSRPTGAAQPTTGRRQAMNQFAILYQERFTRHQG